MSRFTFTVQVETDTLTHAEQVMGERLGPDEDYGFDYTVEVVDVPADALALDRLAELFGMFRTPHGLQSAGDAFEAAEQLVAEARPDLRPTALGVSNYRRSQR